MYEEKKCDIMLIQFNFKNYKSFYEKSYLDMMATSEKRHMENTIDSNGNKLLPFLTIYGANASGKTTVIDAFYCMARAIIRTFDSDINDPFLVVPFAFSKDSKKAPTEFEVFINLNNYEYRYGFSASREKIFEEWLYRKTFKKNSKAKEKMIFERSFNTVNLSDDFNKYSNYSSLISEKSLLLSFLGRKEMDFFGDIYKWFLNIRYFDNINNNLEIFTNYSLNLLYKEKSIYNEFIHILSDIDPCVKDVVIKTKEDENQRIILEPYGKHCDIDNPKKFFLLPLDGESDGTIKMLSTLPMIIKSLMEGSLFFIDELDTKLHPLLYKKIVSMYTNKNINKYNAQLVFTTHNTYLLNSADTRRDQVMFVEKDKTGKSRLYSLAEFKMLRGDADYEKKYFSGSFGSIPFLK